MAVAYHETKTKKTGKKMPKESSHGRGCNLGPNVSELFSSSREELPGSKIILLVMTALGLAHRNVGRVTRTSLVKVILRVRY